MNEIDKMYELAGCKKILCDCTNCKKTDCTGDVDQDTCVKLTYSPFTAEKQLELIKWLFNSICLLCLAPLQHSENFENDLAGLINELWQDMTDKEKQQVKGILE